MGGNLSTKTRTASQHNKKNGEENGSTRKEQRGNKKRPKGGKKRYLKQVKRDIKSQRVTEDQLYSLSQNLKRTAWYLGRRLDFRERELQKILVKYQTSQETKFHILMVWRSKNGWKASVQNLVIHLELAGYDYEEYKSIVTSPENGIGQIYDKAPEIQPAKTKWKKGHYRYDNYDAVRSIDEAIENDDLLFKDDKSIDQIQSNLQASTQDIIAFARRSWKKPRREAPKSHHPDLRSSLNRTDDSGIVIPQEFSENESKVPGCETSENNSRSMKSETPTSLYIRRCSDSTLNYTTMSSPHNESETELNAIFQGETNYMSTARKVASVFPAVEVAKENATEHTRQESTDSQLESYKLQIAKMSEKHYDVVNHVLNEDKAEAKQSTSSYNFFKFGGKGKFPSRFKGQISGMGLTCNDDIVLSDSDNKRIQIFDKFGNFRTAFDTNSELNPKGVFVTAQTDIVVCCGSEVRVFTSDGNIKLIFGQGSFRNNCYHVICDEIGAYYVTDIVGHTVSVFDNKGSIRKRFGFHGSSLTNFNQPVALAISDRNELLISDSQNHSVKVYSLAGRPLYALGGKGTEDGKFWNPFGLCFDRSGYLYVADCGNNRISLFDQKYKFVRHVLTEADGLKMPSFIKINSIGQLIITEWKNQEVKVFSLETAV